MAVYGLARCSGFFRNLVSATIRPPICNAWYGTIQDDSSEKKQLPPSRPASAFALYLKDNFQEIKESVSGVNKVHVTTLMKVAGEMWQKLPNVEQKKYFTLHQQAMVSYSDKLKDYKAELTPEQLEQIKHDQWKLREEKKIKKAYQVALAKHPMPKRPKPALWVYGAIFDGKDCNIKELTKKVRAGWAQLPYGEKEGFVADYKEKMEEWKIDYGHWIQDMVQDGYSDFITPHELKQELQRLGKPKRPLTAFFLYQRACQMEKGNMSVADFSKELGSRWKQMSDEEKQVFIKESKKEHDKYINVISQWKAGLESREISFTEMAEKVLNGSLEKQLISAEKLLAKEKEKEQLAKQKEKEKLAKQKEKEKEKLKLAKQKEKEKLAKQKEKEKEKLKLAKQKEKEKLAKQKEKEKLK